MSNNHRPFHGELLPPEVVRKGIYELGKVARIPPTVGIFDEPTRCFKANLEWCAHILGMVGLLADVVSWQDAEDESYPSIIEILKFKQGFDCDMTDYRLRQKPDDLCILQQSIDAGTTWTDVFDFSQCITIQDKSYQVMINEAVNNYVPTLQDIYNNYVTNYAGSPGDVYPELEAPAGDDSAYAAAYCNAVSTLVRSVSDAAIDYYAEQIEGDLNEFNFFVAVSLFVVAAIGVAGAIPTGGASLSLTAMAGNAALVAAGIGLGAGLVNFGVDYLKAHTAEQFEDAEARDEVTCYLIDEVPAASNTKQAMIDALTSHALTGNAAIIADFLAIAIQADVTYAAFLDKWRNNTEYAAAGINLECPCASEYKVQVINFADGGKQGWEIDTIGVAGSYGQWAGDKWQGTSTAFDEKNIQISRVFDPAWRVHGIKLHLTRENGTGDGGKDTSNAVLRPTPNSTTGQMIIQASGFQANGDVTPCADNPASPTAYWTGANQIFVSAQVNDGAGAQIYIRKIEIIYIAAFSPDTGYITDDHDICT